MYLHVFFFFKKCIIHFLKKKKHEGTWKYSAQIPKLLVSNQDSSEKYTVWASVRVASKGFQKSPSVKYCNNFSPDTEFNRSCCDKNWTDQLMGTKSGIVRKMKMCPELQ